MSKNKTQMSSEQIYRRNKRRSKIFGILSPLIWYLLLITTAVFFFLMIENSVGNVTEILNLLDKEKYNGEELQQNYKMLIEKWGEWEIVGEDKAGIVVRYVNVGNAMFSGLAKTYMILMFVTLSFAILLGKLIFPALKNHYKNCNDELINVATLQSAEQINEMHKKGKDWF